MNPFYDLSEQRKLPIDSLQLKNLGTDKIIASIGKKVRDDWGGRSTEWNRYMTAVKPEDYDCQFVLKLFKTMPIYNINSTLDHHLFYYWSIHQPENLKFFKNMRYVALPELKKLNYSEVCVNLFEEWLVEKMADNKTKPSTNTVNNTINSINAPVQFQQNPDHSTQTQNNDILKYQFKDFLEVLRKDIEKVDKKIRKDFAIEMDYAVSQLERERDFKPQLLNIGSLMKDVGIGTFTNVLAAPIFEIVKPFLGLS